MKPDICVFNLIFVPGRPNIFWLSSLHRKSCKNMDMPRNSQKGWVLPFRFSNFSSLYLISKNTTNYLEQVTKFRKCIQYELLLLLTWSKLLLVYGMARNVRIWIYILGQLDDLTKELLNADRCGVPDFVYNQRNAKRTKRYTLNGKTRVFHLCTHAEVRTQKLMIHQTWSSMSRFPFVNQMD